MRFIDLDFMSFIVDDVEEIVGFGLMVPSMAVALKKAGGSYLPTGWWHLIQGLKGKNTETIDMFIIAVRKDLQKQGVPALIVSDLHPRLIARGFKQAESNPELETNADVQNLWGYFSARIHKRRRVYGKSL